MLENNEKELKRNYALDINTTVLAYMGDSIYEVFIREMIILSGDYNADSLHRRAIKYVSARGQALAIKTISQELENHELSLVKRARNRRVNTKAKNTDMMTYKWATAFEALLGYLYISGENDRLHQLMKRAKEVIDEQGRQTV